MTQPQESTGRLLAGRYRLDEVLGRGGMGTVWRAEDEMLGRIVAVKELRMTGAVDEDEKHRLVVRTLREAKATARIRHTAAVTVFDVVEEDERPWIVMELVESRSLAEVIKEDGTLTPVRAAEIALDVLGVLVAAHGQGILHRDVKPSNVLIGEDGRVVLTDFGIASVEGDTSITSTGMLVGAPSYISPERARGQKPGPPADLWSLGGTLYSMVEGRPPYDRGSALATLTAVMTEELAAPENAGPLRPVIEGLLAKDPAQRLDAVATRAMLKRIVADGGARAEATTQQAVPAPAVPAPDTDTKSTAGTDSKRSAGRPAVASAGAKARWGGGRPRGADTAGDGAASSGTDGRPAGARASWGAGRSGGAVAASGAGVAMTEPAAAGRVAGAGEPGPVAAVRRGSGEPVRVGSRPVVQRPPAGDPETAPPASPVPVPVPVPAAARRRRTLLLAGAGLVLVLALVIAVVLWPRGADGGTGGTAQGGAATAAAGQSAAVQPPPGAPSAAASPGAASPGTSAGGAALPAGYTVYKDGQGFSIALPGWLTKQSSGENRRTFTGNGYKLVVEWTDKPGPSALADWQSADRSANFTNYRRINVAAAPFRDWSNSADWEWTYTGSAGSTLHALNRGLVTGNGKYGYAVYWTIPDADWSSPAAVEARRVSFDTFQPAP